MREIGTYITTINGQQVVVRKFSSPTIRTITLTKARHQPTKGTERGGRFLAKERDQ